MFYKEEFITTDFSAVFTQVGYYDLAELQTSGYRNDANVSVEMDALCCLKYFPCVQNLILKPGLINIDDLQYLYNLPLKRLKLNYFNDSFCEYTIDLGQFPNLEFVSARDSFNFYNVDQCAFLKTLHVYQWSMRTLELLGRSNIVALKISVGKLISLKGIESLSHLRYFSLSYQRSLTDVRDIGTCVSLEHLEMVNCGKVDITNIPMLDNLKILELSGRQVIDNCYYFKRFPKLEYLILGCKILDGDLSRLLLLKHCALLTDHRHYTHKNSDLPKSDFRRM